MTSIAERHKYILESLAKNGFIKVNEIAKELEVTPVTIRKDLKHLEEKKLLYRTHGSASPVNPLTSDIDVHEKEKLRKEEKKRIATAAAKLIEENDSIIIASGSTVHTFAEHITPINHLTVVTASLKTSLLLNTINNIEVIQLGGIVRKNSFSVIGQGHTNYVPSCPGDGVSGCEQPLSGGRGVVRALPSSPGASGKSDDFTTSTAGGFVFFLSF